MRRIAYILLLLIIIGLMACSEPVVSFKTGTAAVERGDYKTAFAQFTELAKEGDVRGEYTLGVMYINGRGVPKDTVKAEEWFRKAADRGFVKAQYNLGCMYDFGIGVPRDISRAFGWYSQAANQGLVEAQLNLALLYDDERKDGMPRNRSKSYMWIALAMARDDKFIGTMSRLKKFMTSSEIEEGKRLLKDWSRKHAKK